MQRVAHTHTHKTIQSCTSNFIYKSLKYKDHVCVCVCACQVLGTVSLPGDLPLLSSAEWLCALERRQVNAIAHLLNQLAPDSSAVITSADTLLTELFSHKGETHPSTVYIHLVLSIIISKDLKGSSASFVLFEEAYCLQGQTALKQQHLLLPGLY